MYIPMLYVPLWPIPVSYTHGWSTLDVDNCTRRNKQATEALDFLFMLPHMLSKAIRQDSTSCMVNIPPNRTTDYVQNFKYKQNNQWNHLS